MKNLRSALLCILSLSTAACGGDLSDVSASEDLSSQGSTEQRALPAPPPLSNYCPGLIPGTPYAIPTAPTPLSSIPSGTPLYPHSPNLLSAHTVIVTDPTNSGAFYAFGFDVRAHRIIFWVSGTNAEIRRFNTQLATDITVMETSTGVDMGFTWGTSGQIGGPLIPLPGVHDGAWKVAYNNWYQLDAYLVSPPTGPLGVAQ